MATCPNTNLKEWKDLVKSRGEDISYFLWDKYKGFVPESQYKLSEEVYRGLPVIQDTNIINAEGKKGAAQYDRGNKIIKVNRELLKNKYKEKAWTNMRELVETLHGEQVKSKAENLDENQFKTYEEFENFVIEHEYQHSLYSRKDFQKDNPKGTKGQYETTINNRALEALNNPLIQQTSGVENETMNQFNSKLSQKLLDFLKGLNITVEFNQDELLKNLNYKTEPLAAFDTLQKFLALGSNATEKDLVRQTANILYTFLGKKSELGVSIWKSVDKWEGYQRVYDRFKNRKQEISEDIEYDLEGFSPFAHKQAIIEFLSQTIERGIDNNFNPSNLKNPDLTKQYFSDKNYRDKYEKNLIILLYNKIWNFIQEKIIKNKLPLEKNAIELREATMDIVNDVFEKDYRKFIRVFAEKDGTVKNIETGKEYNQKDYQETLNKDPFAARIIQKLFNNPFIDYKLSGSQVIRKYGTLFRSLSEDLHDIDGVITLEQFASEKNALEFNRWLKTRGKRLMANRNQTKFQKELLPFLEDQNWYKNVQNSFPNWTLQSAFIGRDHKKQESVTITGYVEHPTETETTENGKVRPKRYILDFFLRTDEGNYPEIFDNYWKDWKQIFEAKLNMGRAKDLNDLIYFTPFKSDKYKFTNKGFRYFTFLDSRIYEQSNVMNQVSGTEGTASPEETLSKVKKVLDKMGVSMQLLTDYAKDNPSVDVSNANALADLAAGIVAVAEGKEDVALTEEMVHIATAIIEQTNPKLITEMIRKIGGFKIYKDTLAEYRNLKEYQLPNGKPNIRKIKKEAVDKLIAEIISEGDIEAYTEDARSFAMKMLDKILDWFRVNVKKTNIDIFKSTASTIIEGDFEGSVSDLNSNQIFKQAAAPTFQKQFQDKVQNTLDTLEKIERVEVANPVNSDDSESNNYYEFTDITGKVREVANRVTDKVKAWYEKRFNGPYVAKNEQEEKDNEVKKDLGIKYHDYFEDIGNRFFNSDGTRRLVPSKRLYIKDRLDSQVYTRQEKYFTDLIAEFSKDGKSPLVFSELQIYDPTTDTAGTIDLLIVEEDGTAHVFDWKFMSLRKNPDGGLDSTDVSWFKKGAYKEQLKEYKRILETQYGIKKFGKNRFIPFILELTRSKRNQQLYLTGVEMGSVNPTKIEPLYLVPVSEDTESTGFKGIDDLINQLNVIYKNLESKGKGLSDADRRFKVERMNLIETAMRRLRGGQNIGPLVDAIELVRQEANSIKSTYEIYNSLPADTTELTEKQKSEFAIEAANYIAVSDIFGTSFDAIGDLIYKKGDENKEGLSEEQIESILQRKLLLQGFQNTTTDIRRSKKEIEEILVDFVDKFTGEANLVTGLSAPEPLIKNFWRKTFSGMSSIGLKSLDVLSKMLNLATAKANSEALSEVDELVSIQERIRQGGGNVKDRIKALYQKEETKDGKGGQLVNKLIYKYQKAFRDEADKVKQDYSEALTAKEKSKARKWLYQNIDVEEYKKEADVILIDYLKKQEKAQLKDEKTGNLYYPKYIQEQILEAKRKWDIEREDFNGFNNYIVKRHPLPKWESKEYIALKKDKPLFDMYNFITRINEKANQIGYISNQVGMTFLPFVRKGTAEQLAWDMTISPVKQFANALAVQADDVGYGNINELTNEVENGIPKYYTYDFTKGKDNKINNSELSMELFKNIITYVQHVNRYKYLSEIEGQVLALKQTQKFKENYLTGTNSLIQKDSAGNLKTVKGDMTNVEILDSFIKSGLYSQKYTEGGTDIGIPNVMKGMKKIINNMSQGLVGKDLYDVSESPDQLSLQRSMDFLNRYIQYKSLGGEFISGSVNAFGTAIQISAQSGIYFDTREVVTKSKNIALNKFKNADEKEMYDQLLDTFMPLKDDPMYNKLRKAGMTKLTRTNPSDLLFIFFRMPEQVAEKAIFSALLDNTMVVDGKLINIKDYVKKKYADRYSSPQNLKLAEKLIKKEVAELKKTKSISVTKKLENGKLVIPGLDLNNRVELQKLTSLTRSIARSATGGQTEFDSNLANQNVWMRSLMVFKNWIPKLTETRFSEFRKISDGLNVEIGEDGLTTGEKYDIGRVRLFFGVLGSSVMNKSNDIYNIMAGNEKGIERLDEMFLKYQEKYLLKRGESLNMTKEDFYDLIRTNLRNEIKELAALLTLLALTMSMGLLAPDDDTDKATKNRFRFIQRTIDRFLSELLFFYNPGEMTQTLSGGIPAIGIFKDISRFMGHFTEEITGLDLSNPDRSMEEVRKNAQPIKNAMKLFPISKSFVNYFAIFDEDFAKEFDVTIQKTSR